MPDLGLTKAIGRAVRRGAQKATVKRPGEELLEQAAKPVDQPTPETVPEAVAAPEAAPVAAPETAVADVPPAPVDGVTASQPNTERMRNISKVQRELSKPIEPVSAEDLMEPTVPSKIDIDESHQLNFEKITSAEDVKATIAQMAEANKARVNAARRNVVTDTEMRRLADDVGASESYLKKVLTRETGGQLSPEVIMATRQWVNTSAARLRELAEKVTKGQASDVDRVALLRQQQLHAAVYDQLMGSRAEWGRTGRVLNAPIGDDPTYMKRMRETVDNVYGKTSVDEMAKLIVDAGNTRAITKVAKQFHQSKFWGVLNELSVNAYLSTPVSHFRNAAGNAIMAAIQIPETAWAARIGRFRKGDEHVQIGEASALLHGNISAFKDALRLAGRTLKTGRVVDDVHRYDTGQFKQISSENLLPPNWRDTLVGQTLDIVGEVIRAPAARGLGSMDEFFKTLAYRAELQRQAYLKALNSTRGLDNPEQIREVLDDIVQETQAFMEAPPAKVKELSEEYSRYVAFQSELGRIGKMATALMRSHGFLSSLAPFIRTPINIFKNTIGERTPLALLSAKFRADLMGKNGGRASDMAAARLSMGTATSLMIGAAVLEGTITGPGPSNPAARKVLEQTGWKPYSFRFYDPTDGEEKYKSYLGTEPMASVLGLTATVVELQQAIEYAPETLQDEDQQVNNIAAAIVIGIAENTTNKSYIKGLTDFAEVIDDPQRHAGSWLKQAVVSRAPYSGARAFATKIQDPYMREAWTLSEKLRAQSGIPGYSEDAPPARDLFGEPREWGKGSFAGVWSPMPESLVNYDPVAQEIKRVMQESRLVPITMPAQHIDGMKLNSKEYDDLVRLARKEPAPNGLTFHEALREVMDSSVYGNATPDMKAELLRKVQNDYDGYVKAPGGLLEEVNGNYAERISAYRQKKQRLKYGE